MQHYKELLDPGVFVGPQDFTTDKTITISRVVREDMPKRDGEDKTSSPMMYFSHAGTELPRKYKVPKSVLYGLSLLYGTDIDQWVGKKVTLFAAKCMSFGEVEECVRIRFPDDIDAKIFKWLKKRKSNRSAYILKETA
jgi:hypothetical protein